MGRRLSCLKGIKVKPLLAAAQFPFLTSFALTIFDQKLVWDDDEMLALDSFLKRNSHQLCEVTLPRWDFARGPLMDDLRRSVSASLSRAPLLQLEISYRAGRQLALSGISLHNLTHLTLHAILSWVDDSGNLMSTWPVAPCLKMVAICVMGKDEIDWRSLALAYPNLEHLCVDWSHAVSLSLLEAGIGTLADMTSLSSGRTRSNRGDYLYISRGYVRS